MSNKEHFIVPVSYYLIVLVALLFLTFVTVAIAQFDFGSFNILVAMLVAVVKASLVVGFFMGLHWERGFLAVFFFASLLAIVLFFLFVFSDLSFRGDIEPKERGNFDLKTPVTLVEPGQTSAHH
jgi:cytochrome c oxidase subunit IV